MNRTILIMLGGLILLILLGVWVYILLFGAPERTSDVFANFGFQTDEQIDVPLTDENNADDEVIVDVGDDADLQQLTTRQVIGYREVQSTSTNPIYMYYAEAGTGHVYRINLESGEENRISNTTIPAASAAAFSSSGRQVAIRGGVRGQESVTIGTLSTSTSDSNMVTEVLPQAIEQFTFLASDDLVITEITGGQTIASIVDSDTFVREPLFSVPFPQAQISWGNTATSSHLAYAKPTHRLQGHVFQTTTNRLQRLPISGYGLTAEQVGRSIFYNASDQETYTGYLYNPTATTTSRTINQIILPRKCDAPDTPNTTALYCGHALTQYPFAFPDVWYQGTETYSDIIWGINTENGIAAVLVFPPDEVGRQIDVTDMYASNLQNSLYFINKRDNTLWTYAL